jgi:hypothetical protein
MQQMQQPEQKVETGILILHHKYPQYANFVLLDETPSCSRVEEGIRFSSEFLRDIGVTRMELCWIPSKSGEIGSLPDYYRVNTLTTEYKWPKDDAPIVAGLMLGLVYLVVWAAMKLEFHFKKKNRLV